MKYEKLNNSRKIKFRKILSTQISSLFYSIDIKFILLYQFNFSYFLFSINKKMKNMFNDYFLYFKNSNQF
jgi:hypothetical protein